MCGIVGITSNKQVTNSIINSLRKLEYRGYDSAGIATLNNGHINEVKSEGRVDVLEKNLSKSNLKGNNIGEKDSFSVIASSISEFFNLKNIFYGDSFLKDIIKK